MLLYAITFKQHCLHYSENMNFGNWIIYAFKYHGIFYFSDNQTSDSRTINLSIGAQFRSATLLFDLFDLSKVFSIWLYKIEKADAPLFLRQCWFTSFSSVSSLVWFYKENQVWLIPYKWFRTDSFNIKVICDWFTSYSNSSRIQVIQAWFTLYKSDAGLNGFRSFGRMPFDWTPFDHQLTYELLDFQVVWFI